MHVIEHSERKQGEYVFEGPEIQIFGSPDVQLVFTPEETHKIVALPQDPDWQSVALAIKHTGYARKIFMKDGKLVVWHNMKNKDAITNFANDVVGAITSYVQPGKQTATVVGEPEELHSTSTRPSRKLTSYSSTNSKPEAFGNFAGVIRMMRAEQKLLATATFEERLEHYRLTAAAPRSSLLSLPGIPQAGSHRELVCASNVTRPGDPQLGYYADARVL